MVKAETSSPATRSGPPAWDLPGDMDFNIYTTDLYVRFCPQDSLQYAALANDTTLTLFPFPLDYEILEPGDYFIDFQVNTSEMSPIGHWFYTTVKPDHTFPAPLQTELLDSLFIPEHSEYYSEIELPDAITGSAPAVKSSTKQMTGDFVKMLLVAAFELTGNAEELMPSPEQEREIETRATYAKCTRKQFLSYSWTSCDEYYYPEGYIKVDTPAGEKPVKGTMVRLWRWFYYHNEITNANGYYRSSVRFNSLWIGNSINYHIIFRGERGGNRWELNKSLAGALCLWDHWYGAGYHSPNGHSMTFYTNSYYWGKCVLTMPFTII